MKKNAFTIIEIMIVVVIFGLLVAMAIPACQKVHENTVVDRGRKGYTLSVDDQAIYERWKIANPALVDAPAIKYSTITIDGRKYYLVPVPE